jgi:MFS family permease
VPLVCSPGRPTSTLGQIGIAVIFGATFADLAPADLRGRYMGVTSTTWSLGAVLGPLLGTALLDHAGRTALWAACSATGLALFAAQQAVAPALRRRTSAPGVRRPTDAAWPPTQPRGAHMRSELTPEPQTASLTTTKGETDEPAEVRVGCRLV